MLVLHMKVDEEIVIGDDMIRILLVRDGHGGTRVGFTAPPDVPIHRAEVFDRIKAAGRPITPGGNLRTDDDGR
jgi:carbon storage regulator